MEHYDLYGVDLPSQVKLLPSYELRSKRSQIPSLDNVDIYENYVQTISSNYFDITDFSNTFSFLKKYFPYYMVIPEFCQKTLISFALCSLHLGFHLTYLESLKPNKEFY